MALAFVCDFDGTVAPADIGARLVGRFSPPGALDDALERWRAGTLGHRELTEIECRHLDVDAAEAEAFVRDFDVDPEFPAFVAWARAQGHEVEIVSEGFDFYIRGALERAGLSDVALSSNRLRFEGRRPRPEFPYAADGCGTCGNCKGARVRAHRARGREVVFVGDGLSDRHGAAAADRVVARDALWDWCRAEGIAAEPFTGFAALSRRFAERSGAAAPSPRAAHGRGGV